MLNEDSYNPLVPGVYACSLSLLPDLFRDGGSNKNIFFVIDSNLFGFHQNKIRSTISVCEASADRVGRCFFKPGEQSKTFKSCQDIIEALLDGNFGRDTTLVAIGGGITGDVAGFAAATYMRGIPVVQVPTTLLAMVDSSIGGKTGVNFRNTKNLIGAFHPADFVLLDRDFLGSLPDDELICGAGEAFKAAILSGGKLYRLMTSMHSRILNREPEYLDAIIEESVKFKANVVAQDGREKGLRKILNLGHSFAHGFEIGMNFSIKHGQAVILGISCALELSVLIGLMPEVPEDINEVLNDFRPSISIKRPDCGEIYSIMKRDKKNLSGELRLVLMSAPGCPLIDQIASRQQVLSALDAGLARFIN